MWLDKKLKEEIRKIFEPRFDRKLNNDEVIEIAKNLTQLMETYFKHIWRLNNEKKIGTN